MGLGIFTITRGSQPLIVDSSSSDSFASCRRGSLRPGCDLHTKLCQNNVLLVELQNNNFTYDIDQGGFSEDNELSIDQRGFKTFIQKEAEEFLKPEQVLLNATVRSISYSGDGVTVTLVDGSKLSADYGLTTFSLGVLQHDDVTFEPELPLWKQEAIHSMDMVRIFIFTKCHLTGTPTLPTGNLYENLPPVPVQVLV